MPLLVGHLYWLYMKDVDLFVSQFPSVRPVASRLALEN